MKKILFLFGAAAMPLLLCSMEETDPLRKQKPIVEIEGQKPYEQYKDHAETIYAFVNSVDLVREGLKGSALKIPQKEWMKTAYAFAKKDGNGFTRYLNGIEDDSWNDEEKVRKATSFLGRMLAYREHKSDEHKLKEKKFNKQRKYGLCTTAVTTVLGVGSTILAVFIQNWLSDQACADVAVVATNMVVNGTLGG